MKKYDIDRAKSCSKYSLWVVYSWLAEKFDTFKNTMEKIKQIRMETISQVKRVQNLEGFTQKKEEIINTTKKEEFWV